MKTFVTSTCAVLLAAAAIGQVTITASAFPNPGDQHNFLIYDDMIDPGDAGQDQTWDFSAIEFSPEVDGTEYIAPASTGYADDFPSATVATGELGDYSFMSLSDESYEELGMVTSGGEELYYNNTLRRAEFPLQFGASFYDEYAGNYYAGGMVIGTASGYIYSEVDGEGTLIANGHTYTNCIRIHQADTIQTIIGGYEVNSYTHHYLWFAEGLQFPVAEYTELTMVSEDMNYTYGSFGVTTAEPVTVSINDPGMAADVLLYPNPAVEEIFIHADHAARYRVLDLTGKTMLSGTLRDGRSTVSVARLPHGLYFLELSDDRRVVSTQRFVVSH